MQHLHPCENCGRMIGRLETPHVWDEQVVCAQCHAALSGKANRAVPEAVAAGVPTVRATPAAGRYCGACGRAVPTEGTQYINTEPYCPECFASYSRPAMPRPSPVPRPVAPSREDLESAAAAALANTARIARRPADSASPRRRQFRQAALIGVWLLALAGAVLLSVKMVRDWRASHKPDVVVNAPADDPGPDGGVYQQLNQLMTDARTLEAAGQAREAAIKYKTVVDFLAGQESIEPRHQALLTEAKEKLPKLTRPPASASASVGGNVRMPQRSIFDAGVTIQFGDSAPPATAATVKADPAPAPGQAQAPKREEPAPPAGAGRGLPPAANMRAPVPAPVAERSPDRIPDLEPPQKPSTPSNPPIVRSDAEGYIDQGIKHLLAAEYDAADSEFKNALKLEPKNGRAFHGRGLVALLKSRPGDATALMETALKNQSPGALPPRSLVYNLAAAHLKTNPMRSARIVKDYLSHPGAGLDEQMANALGAALNVADDSARNHFFYNEARDYYLKYDQKLAIARGDGRQRWGTEWLPAGQAAAKWALYRQRAEGVADLRARVGRATVDKAKAYDNLRYMQRGMRLHSTAEKRAANDKYEDAARHEISLRQQLARAESQMSATEAPPLPTSLDPVLDP